MSSAATPVSPARARAERIEANCKIIWGDDKEYDIFHETDDYVYYICYVRTIIQKNRFPDPGPVLVQSPMCPSEAEAWTELDKMLAIGAKNVKASRDSERQK
ncbi:hypothetical protein N656DRAFT_780764 [Canariomyces notabilis]|uniref:Uncharacterized protein n=1 Tax=Canariomyces notabilis TaxID=2074819 RepID=A0AAN6YR40_9PEZI|nr:hypothetical protein N656DRAFT_780764 [Canariomyces arenarius]